MKLSSLSLHKNSASKKAQPLFTLERFFLQHAITFFVAATGVLLVLFLIFFYLFFYRAVSGISNTESDTIHDSQKTINLGAYGHAVDSNHTKTDTGKEYASGAKTISNPFVNKLENK